MPPSTRGAPCPLLPLLRLLLTPLPILWQAAAQCEADPTSSTSTPAPGCITHLSATQGVSAVAFSWDGARLLSGDEGAAGGVPSSAAATTTSNITVWDVVSGEVLLLFDSHAGSGAIAGIAPLPGTSSSPRLAASICATDTQALIWDVDSGSVVRTLPHTAPPSAIATGGSLIATATPDGVVVLWDEHTDTPQALPSGSGSSFTQLTFSPDGDLLAGLETSAGATAVHLWNTTSMQEVLPAPASRGDGPASLAFAMKGAVLALGYGPPPPGVSASFFGVSSGVEVGGISWHPGANRSQEILAVPHIASAPDGLHVVVAGRDALSLWLIHSNTSGHLSASMQQKLPLAASTRGIAVSVEGLVAAGGVPSDGGGGSITLWNAGLSGDGGNATEGPRPFVSPDRPSHDVILLVAAVAGGCVAIFVMVSVCKYLRAAKTYARFSQEVMYAEEPPACYAEEPMMLHGSPGSGGGGRSVASGSGMLSPRPSFGPSATPLRLSGGGDLLV